MEPPGGRPETEHVAIERLRLGDVVDDNGDVAVRRRSPGHEG